MSLLQVQDLSLRFGGLTAVRKLDLDIREAEIFAIIGPNGAGKTSVFNAISGIYSPTEGRILIESRPPVRPFSTATLLQIGLVGLLAGVGAFAAVHSEDWWNATIVYNYVYQQPFDWNDAFADAIAFIGAQPPQWSSLPFILGAAVGSLAAFATWLRARRSPDIVAQSGVARTFQNIRLFQQMSVLENVVVGMETHLRTRLWDAAFRLPRYWSEQRRARKEAMEILRFVGLEDEWASAASELSYGHQRKLEIARALAASPKVILLDEPAAGMNPSEGAELSRLIKRIRDAGRTVVLIEHHMKVVMGVSDRIAVLDYGNKIAEGCPDQIRQDPLVRKAYLGPEDI